MVRTPLSIQPAETDLIGTRRDVDAFEPHTVHTHYFGFQVPEAAIGAFTYIRYQPYFGLAQGSVMIFQGLDNRVPLDVAFLDWQMAMPYPTVEGRTITTSSGFRVEFLEFGESARIGYESKDASFDIVQTAVTPLVARGAVIPGENLHASHEPGGSEQFMHCTGSLRLRGEDYAVDCFMPRDRSWRQSRTEERGGRHDPPIAWTPFYFPESELAFNQVGFESPGTNPVWEGALAIPEGSPTHHFAWVCDKGELREVVRVHRSRRGTAPAHSRAAPADHRGGGFPRDDLPLHRRGHRARPGPVVAERQYLGQRDPLDRRGRRRCVRPLPGDLVRLLPPAHEGPPP